MKRKVIVEILNIRPYKINVLKEHGYSANDFVGQRYYATKFGNGYLIEELEYLCYHPGQEPDFKYWGSGQVREIRLEKLH